MKPRVLVSLVMLLCAIAFLSTKTVHPQSDQGQQTFRFDTFGDEQLWTDTLRMHEVIQSSVSPATALAVGLKVDATALHYIGQFGLGLTAKQVADLVEYLKSL